MHPRIKNILENYTYPIIKSITYPNGDMFVLEGQWIKEKYHLRILCQSTLIVIFLITKRIMSLISIRKLW